MKHTHYLLLFLSLSLVLSGCSFDESLETTQQHDGDDIGVIQNIWPQALDQMLWWTTSSIHSQSWTQSLFTGSSNLSTSQ